MLFSALNLAYAQDFFNQFKSLLKTKDTTAQAILLQKWQISKPTDPDLFIAYFNFYVQRSMSEIMVMGEGKANKAFLEVHDTATGKHETNIYSDIRYKKPVLEKAFEYIDKGISLYPNRLDMRFGKISMLGKAVQYRAFTNEIKQAIELHSKIESKWLWSNNKPLENATNQFLTSIQDYVYLLYESGDKQLPLMREIAEKVLQYYPNHVESLSDISITYMYTKEYNKALAYLLKAEKINPKDAVVLFNIAATFIKMNDKPNAKIYYNKVIKVGNKDDIQEAKERMRSIQ